MLYDFIDVIPGIDEILENTNWQEQKAISGREWQEGGIIRAWVTWEGERIQPLDYGFLGACECQNSSSYIL